MHPPSWGLPSALSSALGVSFFFGVPLDRGFLLSETNLLSGLSEGFRIGGGEIGTAVCSITNVFIAGSWSDDSAALVVPTKCQNPKTVVTAVNT